MINIRSKEWVCALFQRSMCNIELSNAPTRVDKSRVHTLGPEDPRDTRRSLANIFLPIKDRKRKYRE